MTDRYDAVVIGSGPNGLAAAITLAQRQRSVLVVEAEETVGGGLRTAEVTVPGFRHDICATVHTLGAGSPFLRTLPLEDHGLAWAHPDIPLAHPLDGGRAALLHQSIDETAAGLGPDGDRYRAVVGTVVERWDRLEDQVLGPLARLPRHPLDLMRFGLRALPPATWTAGRFTTEEAAGLFAGCAAHVFLPLGRPLTSAFGILIATLAHRFGWPFARGGSQALADAMAAHLTSLGGVIETGRRITNLSELPRSGVVLADLSPGPLADLLADRLPEPVLAPYRRFRHGPAAFKVDYALSEPMPWSNADLARAGTLHLGGTAAAIAAAEASSYAGAIPARPFTLVAQPSLFDRSRVDGEGETLWAYAHVPNGSTHDHLPAIERQIEELAPGFRDVVVARTVMTPPQLEAYNPNYVGGDIAGGAHTLRQLVFRPVPRANPYATPLDRVFICSASTPPGAGAHGMCGHLAAESAYRLWLS